MFVLQLKTWVPNDSVSENDFMRAHRKIQENRRAILKDACRKYHKEPPRDVAAHMDKNTMLVDDEHKMMYCFVPKVASTNWKRVFLVLRGIFTSTNVSQYTANRSLRKLRTFRSYKKDDRNHILDTYTKFLFVRHPYSRILSAFKNKLSPDTDFERADYWKNTIGMQIIWRYRRLQNRSHAAWRNISRGYDLRFEEFVKFISDTDRPQQQNKHWKEIYKRCFPCDIDYDIIGKFETLDDDAKYTLKIAKVDKIVAFPKPDASSPTNSSNIATLESYYEKVPRENLQNLVRRYSLDFALFGYSSHTLAADPYYKSSNSSAVSVNLNWSEGLHLFD